MDGETDTGFERDDRVELREAIYGYAAGSRGVVIGSARCGTLLVRFDDTGHTMSVSPTFLRRHHD